MNGPCAACGHTVAFLPVGAEWRHQEGLLGVARVLTAICPNCRSPYIRVMDEEGHTRHDWPNAGDRPGPAGVPAPIADDWREAHKDLGIQTWKSAATMPGRLDYVKARSGRPPIEGGP